MTGAPSDWRDRFYEERIAAESDRFPEKDPGSLAVVLNLLRTYDVVEHYLARRLQPFGLSPSGFNLLMILRHKGRGGCAMSFASELLLVSRANVTGLVDSLEARGLVERTQSETDRRSRTVALTAAGEKLLARILPDHYRNLRQVTSCLSAGEKVTLTKLLARLRGGFAAACAEPES